MSVCFLILQVWISLGITLISVAFTSSILFSRISEGTDPYHFAVPGYLWMYVALMLRQGDVLQFIHGNV